MMAWLLKWLAGAAGPYIVGGVLAVIVGLGGWLGWIAWDNHTLRTEAAEARADTAEARAELATCRTSVADLEAAVARQNERILSLRALADAAAAQAETRAVRTLNRERARTRELPAGHGPQAMNDWMRQAVP